MYRCRDPAAPVDEPAGVETVDFHDRRRAEQAAPVHLVAGLHTVDRHHADRRGLIVDHADGRFIRDHHL